MSNLMRIIDLLLPAIGETLYMVVFSTLFALILGVPLGILLVITKKGHIYPHVALNSSVEGIINIFRSIPFIILIIMLFPLARIIVGTSIGSTAAIVPLSIGAAPFVARIFESALLEVPSGVIEAAKAMGATKKQIVFKVLIPEAMPALVSGLTITIINLIGYSAMAGVIGGGGLGDVAVRYGYQRFQTDVLFATVIVLVVLVQLIQTLGNISIKLIDKR